MHCFDLFVIVSKDDTWSRKEMFRYCASTCLMFKCAFTVISSNIPRWKAMKDLLFLDEIPLQVRGLLYRCFTGNRFSFPAF
jgi:hypothetical protein